MSKKTKPYLIVHGSSREVIEKYEGTWDGCERRMKELKKSHGGCYARGASKEAPKKAPKEFPLGHRYLDAQSKQIRRRKAFLNLPESMQIEDILWELTQIGQIDMVEELKEKLVS